MAEEVEENNVDTDDDPYKGYNHDVDRTEKLFKDLDRNKDGKIDADELAAGLKRLRVRHSKGQLQVWPKICYIFALECHILFMSLNSAHSVMLY